MATYRDRVRIKCDGCQTPLDGAFQSANEARAAAWNAGWKFPAKHRLDGRPSELSSDVCPNCAPEWKPLLRAQRREQAS